MPDRIQLRKRSKLPPNCVDVGPATPLGQPVHHRQPPRRHDGGVRGQVRAAAAWCVRSGELLRTGSPEARLPPCASAHEGSEGTRSGLLVPSLSTLPRGSFACRRQPGSNAMSRPRGRPRGPTPNLTGQRFGLLTVLSEAGRDRDNRPLWEAACSCGVRVVIRFRELTGKGPAQGCPSCSRTKDVRVRLVRGAAVDDVTGCWVWQKSMNSQGYGHIGVGHRVLSAHRVSYEVFVGEIPEGLTIDHLCRNPSCINPAHLEPVTMRENILRGNGVSARNARKQFCKRGHPLVGANVHTMPCGGRRCRVCAKAYQSAKQNYRRTPCA